MRATLRPSGRIPHYRAIADDLRVAIERGKLAIGDRLPKETELSESYNVSRGTIRQSLNVLETEGLITRRQRSGTIVASRFPARGVVERDQIMEDWARYGKDYPLKVHSIVQKRLPSDIEILSKRDKTKSWICVTGLRYPVGSQEPVSYCQAYVHPDYGEVADDLLSSAPPIFSLIEQRHGRVIEVIRIELRSVALTSSMARRLGLPAGSPGLQMIRTFMDAKRKVVEVAMNTHPADRYTYTVDIFRAKIL